MSARRISLFFLTSIMMAGMGRTLSAENAGLCDAADEALLSANLQFDKNDPAFAPNLHGAFTAHLKNTPCDDGAIAEDYSELIVKALSTRPQATAGLLDEMAKDNDFSIFVVRHTHDDMTSQQVTQALKNVKAHCKNNRTGACGTLMRRLNRLEHP